MAEKNGIFIRGKSNGTTTYQDKNGRFFYSVLIIVPGSEQNIRVGLDQKTDPSKFDQGVEVGMEIMPRFYQGKFTGFHELKNN